jgi:cellulose synthase/poly-beta-1,6-N-acetylglucosamine synthase-like glycosyltransferase
MADHVKKKQPIDVQDIWYQRQRWLRTALQTALSFLVAFGGSVALLQAVAPQVLAALADVLPASWIVWISGLFAIVIAIAGTLSKLMAIPIVNAWLTRVGFGSVPRAVAREQAAAKTPELQPATFAPSTIDLRSQQDDAPTS